MEAKKINELTLEELEEQIESVHKNDCPNYKKILKEISKEFICAKKSLGKDLSNRNYDLFLQIVDVVHNSHSNFVNNCKEKNLLSFSKNIGEVQFKFPPTIPSTVIVESFLSMEDKFEQNVKCSMDKPCTINIRGPINEICDNLLISEVEFLNTSSKVLLNVELLPLFTYLQPDKYNI